MKTTNNLLKNLVIASFLLLAFLATSQVASAATYYLDFYSTTVAGGNGPVNPANGVVAISGANLAAGDVVVFDGVAISQTPGTGDQWAAINLNAGGLQGVTSATLGVKAETANGTGSSQLFPFSASFGDVGATTNHVLVELTVTTTGSTTNMTYVAKTDPNFTGTFHPISGSGLTFPGNSIPLTFGAHSQTQAFYDTSGRLAIAATPASSDPLLVGNTTTFTATYQGPPSSSFQWLSNNVPIAGATSLTYTPPPITAANNGDLYTVVLLTNSFNAVTSAPCVLNYHAGPATWVFNFAPTNFTAGSGAFWTTPILSTITNLANFAPGDKVVFDGIVTGNGAWGGPAINSFGGITAAGMGVLLRFGLNGQVGAIYTNANNANYNNLTTAAAVTNHLRIELYISTQGSLTNMGWKVLLDQNLTGTYSIIQTGTNLTFNATSLWLQFQNQNSSSISFVQNISTISYAGGPFNTGSLFTYNSSGLRPTITYSGSTGARTTNYVGTGSTVYSSVNAPTNAGTYYISNTVASDTIYTGTTNSLAFTIQQASSTATVAVNNSPATYNGSGQAATVSITASNTLGTVASILTGGQATQTNSGTYSVMVTFVPANTNYTTLTGLSATNSFTIGAKLASVTANPRTKNYGDTNPTLTATVAGTVNGDTLSYTLNTTATQFSGVGVSNIMVTLGSNPNYSVSATNSTLTINGRPLAITASAQSKSYGTALTLGTTAFTSTGLTNSDSISGVTLSSGGATTVATVGSYTITPSVATGSGLGNYTISYNNGTLTVNAAVLGVTANDTSRAFGAANPTFTASYSGFVNGETIAVVSGAPSLTTLADTNSVVDTYAITASLGSLSATNYTFNLTNGTLTVTPAAITVTADNASRTYGAANPTFTASYAGFVNGDTSSVISGSPTLTTSADTNSPVGSYVITSTAGSLSATNYSFALINGTLTVTTAPLGITANNASKTYDGAGYTGGNGVSYAGFVNGETSAVLGGTLAYGGQSQNATNAGSYTIIPSGLTSANYAISYTNGTLTINPLGVTVTADGQMKVYGASDPALTYSSTPALGSGDSFSGALSRTTGQNVGSYAINQGSLSLSANYTLSYNGTNLVITPAALSITASNASKNYGQTVTFAGTEFTTAGLQFSDSVTSVVLTSAGATNTAAVGSYAIIPSAASGSGLGNYNTSYNNGTLTVNAASAVTVNSPVQLPDGNFQLTFTGGDGGVSYVIQASDNLGSAVWTSLFTNNATMSGLSSYIDSSATNYPVRFYRTVTP